MNRITIDIDQIKEIAFLCIRRAAAFLGLGVNAARDNKFTNYQLSDYSSLRVIPDNLDEKSVAHMKQEFENWVISNGLRELVEGFGLFLDEVHRSCLLMATNKRLITTDDANSYGPAFEQKGLEDKFKTLRTRFGVFSDREKYFKGINQARNCITHRRGIVGLEDLRGNECFSFTWLNFDIYVETPTGEKFSLSPPLPKEGIYLKDGGNVVVHVVDRVVEYKLGDIISLSPDELSYICLLVHMTTDEIAKSTYEYAKTSGIKIKMKGTTTQQDVTANQP